MIKPRVLLCHGIFLTSEEVPWSKKPYSGDFTYWCNQYINKESKEHQDPLLTVTHPPEVAYCQKSDGYVLYTRSRTITKDDAGLVRFDGPFFTEVPYEEFTSLMAFYLQFIFDPEKPPAQEHYPRWFLCEVSSTTTTASIKRRFKKIYGSTKGLNYVSVSEEFIRVGFETQEDMDNFSVESFDGLLRCTK